MDRYLAGNMSDQERAEFEAWIVGNPQLASDLRTDSQLRRGMQLASRRGWLASSPAASANDWKRSPHAKLAASIAAMAVVGSLAWWAGEREGLQRAAVVTERTQLGTTTQVVSLARYRGSSAPDMSYPLADVPDHLVLQPDVVTLTCTDGNLALTCPDGLSPTTPQYAQYDLEIIRRVGEQPVWHSDLQKYDAANPLTFVIRARELEAGDYDVLVRGTSATHVEVVGRYWLQIQPGGV